VVDAIVALVLVVVYVAAARFWEIGQEALDRTTAGGLKNGTSI
jgi:hypothetical protein